MKKITAKKLKKTIKDGANKITILIVEDDRDLREALAASLRDEGYHALWAQDADEAIASVRAHKVDIIFMDICLPGLNGVEVYKAVKKMRPAAKTVMMTGFFVQDLVNAAISAGAYDVIYKPFTMDDILKVIRKITG